MPPPTKPEDPKPAEKPVDETAMVALAPPMKEVVARSHIHTGKGTAPFKPGSIVKLPEADAEHLVKAGMASWPKEPDADPAQARSAGPSVVTGNAATAAEPNA